MLGDLLKTNVVAQNQLCSGVLKHITGGVHTWMNFVPLGSVVVCPYWGLMELFTNRCVGELFFLCINCFCVFLCIGICVGAE